MKKLQTLIVLVMVFFGSMLFANNDPFNLYLENKINSVYGNRYQALTIVSKTNGLVVKDVIINRGNCKPYNIPSSVNLEEYLTQYRINPFTYGRSFTFRIRPSCHILEIVVKTNKGTYTYDLDK